MNSGSANLGINNLTTGVSKEGYRRYLESVKMEILTSICNEIDNVDGVIAAINNCWQGTSRDKFLMAFLNARELIKKDLNFEYGNFENKFQALVNEMFFLDSYSIYEYDA